MPRPSIRCCVCEFCLWIRTWSLQTWPASPNSIQQRRRETESLQGATAPPLHAIHLRGAASRVIIPATKFRHRRPRPAVDPFQYHCADVDTVCHRNCSRIRAENVSVAINSESTAPCRGASMKLFRLFLFAFAVLASTPHQPTLRAQQATAAPDAIATLSYIHSAWDTLTRSVTDCNSYADVKVENPSAASPVLYLPAELPVPPQVKALEQDCHVKVISLPRRIEKIGDVRPEELPSPVCSICPIRTLFPADASTKCMAGTVTSSSSGWKPIIAKRWPRALSITSCSRSSTTAECSTPTELTTSRALNRRFSPP